MSRVLSGGQSHSVDEAVGARRSRRAQPAEPRDSQTYHLNVVASGVADVVESAGGWLFDRAMAGWAVTAFLGHVEDVRPLRILGVRAVDVHADAPSVTERRGGVADLAVAGDLLATEAWLREEIIATTRSGLAEVVFWGDVAAEGSWSRIVGRLDVVEHRLSAAAHIFKGYAVDAAGGNGAHVGPTETLVRSRHHSPDANVIRYGDPVG